MKKLLITFSLLLAIAGAAGSLAAASPALTGLGSDAIAGPTTSVEALPASLRSAFNDALKTNAQSIYGNGNPPAWLEQSAWLEQKVVAGDNQHYQFGISVAIDGTTAIIGAPTVDAGAGAAYVFTNIDGVWTQTQMLVPSDSAAGNSFGVTVAISGSTAVISAFNQNAGAVYVFKELGGTWSEIQKLASDDGAGNDSMGYSIAIEGATILAGAIATVDGNDNQGAVYVFTENDGTWVQTQKLTADDGFADAYFGSSLSLDGNTALVGAMGKPFGLNPGAAYVFTRSGGNWQQVQKLAASDGDDNMGPGNQFGGVVALSGTSAFIGAVNAAINGMYGVGAAYIFTEMDGAWIQSQKIITDDIVEYDNFGSSVAMEGNTAVVGAIGTSIGGNYLTGAAYVLTNIDGVWMKTQQLTASDGTGNSYYGTVAISGDTVLVGAMFASNFGSGAAYFYTAPVSPSDTIFANGFDGF